MLYFEINKLTELRLMGPMESLDLPVGRFAAFHGVLLKRLLGG